MPAHRTPQSNPVRAAARDSLLAVPCFLSTLALLLAAAAAVPAHAQTAEPPRAQVMVLGVYHMDNPGLDYANVRADDVLSERRQGDLAGVAQALAEFRPTRIALEVEPRRDSVVNARYAGYLRGEYTLGRNETDQIGFRLGRMLGHQRMYLIDYRLDMDVGAVMQAAGQYGQGELAQRMGTTIQGIIAEQNARMATSHVGGILADANSARADSMHGWYLVMATVGRDTAYTGAREVASWYTRNLMMYANIARVAQPGERVLVIVGAGHGYLLRQFIDESPDLDVVSAEPYLARFRTPSGAGASQ